MEKSCRKNTPLRALDVLGAGGNDTYLRMDILFRLIPRGLYFPPRDMAPYPPFGYTFGYIIAEQLKI